MKKVVLIFTMQLFVYYTKAQNTIVQALLNDVRLDSLTNFVKQLSGEKSVVINGITDTIKSRHYLDSGNEKAFQFMKQEFIRFGYQVDSLQFNAIGKNLFAIKTGNKYPSRRYMLGAHYDNLPTTTIAPGADDNASGTATVLEAGRVFSNYNFPYTVVFALWDEEEPGLIGSNAYVQTLGSSNDTLLGYVNVDMLGWDGNNDSIADINVRPVANSISLCNRTQWCNTAYNIQLGLHIVNPGNGATDHAPFWGNNYTAIGIDEEYDNDFNPFWHTQADSLGQFNLSFYKKCSMLAYATIADCATDTTNVVGIKEIENDSEIQVYPNPFTNHIAILSDRQNIIIQQVELFSYSGQLVYNKQVNTSATVIIVNDELEKGTYFLKIYTSENSFIKKIIKQ